jgi:cytochrome P450
VARATTQDMGVPLPDWKIINELVTSTELITNPGADDKLSRAWDQIYAYCADLVRNKLRRPDASLASRFVAALGEAQASQDEIVHVIATNFTGYPTPLAVLIVALYELINQPALAQDFRDGDIRGRTLILGRILRARANFCAAKPRELGIPLELGQGLVLPPGQPLIASVWAALAGGKGWHLAFGSGDHKCPFFNDSMKWLLVAIGALLEAHPGMQLARAPQWQPGLLAVPPALLASNTPAE